MSHEVRLDDSVDESDCSGASCERRDEARRASDAAVPHHGHVPELGRADAGTRRICRIGRWGGPSVAREAGKPTRCGVRFLV